MERNLPEIVFASSDSAESRRIRRLVRSKHARKIAPRVYTSNMTDDPAAIVRRNLYPILGRLFPGAVVSHRTALEAKPAADGTVFLTYKYTRTVKIPGVLVRLLQGPLALENDQPFMEGLFMSSRPRTYLENLQLARQRGSVSKAVPRNVVEDALDRLCQIQGEAALNTLRDQARTLAPKLGMDDSFRKLNGIISAILRSRPARGLTSRSARSRSLGVPYDTGRLTSFDRLFAHLRQNPLPERKETRNKPAEVRLLAFFESYFSNYIEGTEFEIEEAYDIVFNGKVPERRPQDAHDILGTYRVVSGTHDRGKVPTSFEDFLQQLQTRHHTIMEGRPEKLPGEFKAEPNRAGQTHFVVPELVRGTLLKGFELSRAVDPGLPRAIFLMFVVADVHPFVDGNGRVARTMMNAELTHAGLCRIVVPTVLRDDYLLALRALTRSDNPATIIRAMDFAQQFTAQVPLKTYVDTTRVLTECHAFDEPDEARLRLPALSAR